MIACTVWLMQWGCQAQATEQAAGLPADIRLLIDMSGSMKSNDPNNLRQPAVELLVQLLPEGSKAGVWTFGKWVNMLVPHRKVDKQWRDAAVTQAKKINSLGLFTNIGGALEKAALDVASNPENFRPHVILLTDGMVDIDKNTQANKNEWRRVVDEVLPKLKTAGYSIHTIALSDNADKNLLNKLSLATDGIAEVARNADDLMRIFLKAFDVAAPAEQVPFDGNNFVIDSSVEEFTALIFRKNPTDHTQLLSPNKEVYHLNNSGTDLTWHRGKDYDLVTVKQPLEGSWGVDVQMAPDSRITVVSNLNLRVTNLPNNINKGHREELIVSLQEDGQNITDSEFLGLMRIEAVMEAGNDEFELQEFWREPLNNPEDGIYRRDLPPFSKDGIYQLSVFVDGKTFLRQFNHQFTVRPAFGAEVKSVFREGELEYHIIVSSFDTDIDPANTQVIASVLAPGGRKKILPLKASGQDTWQASLVPDKEGKYQARIKAKGQSTGGERFEMSLAPIDFVYDAKLGFVEEEAPFFEETSPQADEDAQREDKEAEKIEPNSGEVVAEDATDAEQSIVSSHSWMLYAALALGNLLLFGLGYFAYKKIMGGQSTEDVLEQFSDEEIAQGGDAEEAPIEEQIEDEEPPMEDLDVGASLPGEEPSDELTPDEKDLDLPEPIEDEVGESADTAPLDTAAVDAVDSTSVDDEAEPEMATENASDSELELDSLLDIDQENAAEMIAEQAQTVVDDIADDFDDLESMAMAENAQEEVSGESEGDNEKETDDDMVAEMLKAQGLDLAEEELDEAISSLIDDLQQDEDKDKQQGAGAA